MRAAVGASLIRAGHRLQGKRGSRNANLVMTRTESGAVLEERVHRLLGMSVKEFECRLVAGELPDTSTVRGLSFLLGEVPAP